jgi:hypothetical protein
VIRGLQLQPPAVAQSEKLAQAQIRPGSDAAFAGDDVADALGRDSNSFGEPVFGHADGIEKFLRKHFAGRNGAINSAISLTPPKLQAHFRPDQ